MTGSFKARGATNAIRRLSDAELVRRRGGRQRRQPRAGGGVRGALGGQPRAARDARAGVAGQGGRGAPVRRRGHLRGRRLRRGAGRGGAARATSAACAWSTRSTSPRWWPARRRWGSRSRGRRRPRGVVVVPLGGGGLAGGIGLAVAAALPGRARGGSAGRGVRALHRLARGPSADRRALRQHDLRRDRGQAPGRLHAPDRGALRGRGRDRVRRRGGRGDGAAARALEARGGGGRRGGRGGPDARSRARRPRRARSARSSRAATWTPRCCPSASASARRWRAAASCSRRSCPTGRGRCSSLLAIVAEHGGNVVDVEHLRDGVDLHVGETAIKLVLQTRGPEHSDEILDAARAEGFSVRVERDA